MTVRFTRKQWDQGNPDNLSDRQLLAAAERAALEAADKRRGTPVSSTSVATEELSCAACHYPINVGMQTATFIRSARTLVTHRACARRLPLS